VRINVYSQELTKEVALVNKVDESNGIRYYGVRLYLASPEILHHTPDDDDRSAITFWIPNANSFTPEDLADVFLIMANQIVDEEGNLRFEIPATL
jgi:hypothetical protein